jgi:hypothetical protein
VNLSLKTITQKMPKILFDRGLPEGKAPSPLSIEEMLPSPWNQTAIF